MDKYGVPFEDDWTSQVYVHSYFDENYEGGSNRQRTFTLYDKTENNPEPNAVSSEMVFREARQNTWENDDKVHRPLLDIDYPIYVVSSSTPNHYHLYIDKPLKWPAYVKLMEALAEVGIIEKGFANASIDRGYSMLRLPGVKKESK